jgi:hypothetical protein
MLSPDPQEATCACGVTYRDFAEATIHDAVKAILEGPGITWTKDGKAIPKP